MAWTRRARARAEWTETFSALLLRHWDVVGVADIDIEPEREYIYEAGQVLAAVTAGGGVIDVAKVLERLAAEMPVASNPDRDLTAAKAIVSAYRSK